MIDGLVLAIIGGLILIFAFIIKAHQEDIQESRRVRAITHSPTQALTTGDVWYRQALNMARVLEHMKADPMLCGTWDTKTEKDVDKALEKFWSDNQVEE